MKQTRWLLFPFVCLAALVLGHALPILGAPVLAIILGAIFSPYAARLHLAKAARKISKHALLAAVVLLGLSLDSNNLGQLHLTDWLTMIATVLFGLTLTGLVAWLLKVRSTTGLLVAVGTSICGGSAIAAVAGVAQAKEEESAQALSTIFAYNILAALLFPLLGHALGLDQERFGKWAGSAINDTSSVLAATFVYGGIAGAVGMQVKMARTLMILPVSLGVAWQRKRSGKSGGNWTKVVPWPAIGFAIALLIHFLASSAPASLWHASNQAGHLAMVVALAGIGLGSPLKTLWTDGRKALLAGGIGWIGLAVTVLYLIN